MDNEFQKFFLESVPVICRKCGGKLFYEGNGTYKCHDCGETEMDDFGKIKQYLEKNGATPAVQIAEDTGISINVINVFLRDGRLEIPEGSKIYIKCERCGCALRFGRYCADCTRQLAGEIKGAYYENMGQQPKVLPQSKDAGKMHSLENLKRRNKK